MPDQMGSYGIDIEAAGGDQAAGELEKVAAAERRIEESHVALGGTLSRGLETGGFHILTHEALQSVGATGAMRAVMPLVHFAVREVDTAMVGLAGSMAAVTLGATVLITALVLLIEHHQKHTEAVETATDALSKLESAEKEFLLGQDPVIQSLKEQGTFLLEQGKFLENQVKLYKDDVYAQYGYQQQLDKVNQEIKKNLELLEEATSKKKEDTVADEDWTEQLLTDQQSQFAAIDETTNKMKADFEQRKEEQKEFLTFSIQTSKLIGEATAKTAEGNMNAWHDAGIKIVEDFAGMIEKQLELDAIAKGALLDFAGVALDIVGIGAVEAGKTAFVGSNSGVSAGGGSASPSTSSPGTSTAAAQTAAPSPAAGSAPTSVHNTFTVNAGILFAPDKATMRAAISELFREAFTMQQAGQLPSMVFD